MIIRNGMVYDAIHKEAYRADIALRGGKITEIAEVLQPQGAEEVVDAAGLRVYPGIVEAHSHLGVRNSLLGGLPSDLNENSDPLTPHLRAIDSFYPQDESVSRALAAGITTVCTGPGSTNVLGGTFIVAKTCHKNG